MMGNEALLQMLETEAATEMLNWESPPRKHSFIKHRTSMTLLQT
jgi:hypothetical protein